LERAEWCGVTCDVSVVESRCRRRFLVGGGGVDDRRAGKWRVAERSLDSRKTDIILIVYLSLVFLVTAIFLELMSLMY
jgi:hypothetical protein